MLIRLLTMCTLALMAVPCLGHDTWIQVNSHSVRKGDVAHIDLMLGNHGNEHRDYLLASKTSPERGTFELRDPSGKVHDLKKVAVDVGATPKEGFWSARFVTKEDGLHSIVQTTDGAHGTTRTIKSAKSYFVVGAATTNDTKVVKFSEPLGHDLELIPLSDPATVSAGSEIKVRVEFRKQPLKGARVSFIPRGKVLAAGFDDQYERRTDELGTASLTPTEGNYFLIVVHHLDPTAKGNGYDNIQYGATLNFCVPQISAIRQK